mmetsp:Transcript_49033/g.36107  ORF Transcript_49033/g.36107 Transcript_49033/m.36107 type:complete len:94 (+) Transcript_49033:71-352(+)
MNMEKIMQRFSNFNTLVSTSSNEEEGNEEEDKKEHDDIGAFLEEQNKHDWEELMKKEELTPKAELKQEYVDHVYWKVDYLPQNIDDLLAEMEN